MNSEFPLLIKNFIGTGIIYAITFTEIPVLKQFGRRFVGGGYLGTIIYFGGTMCVKGYEKIFEKLGL